MKCLSILVVCMQLIAIASAEDFALKIVPSKVSEEENLIDGTSSLGPFFVVLTNKSSSDKLIWRDWCMWGYSSLTFTIISPGEKPFDIQPPSRGWTMNFPDSYLIRPGESYVWSVDLFKEKRWQGFPSRWNTSGGFGHQDRKVSIVAHFRIRNKFSSSASWKGDVFSNPMWATLRCPNTVTEQDAAANP